MELVERLLTRVHPILSDIFIVTVREELIVDFLIERGAQVEVKCWNEDGRRGRERSETIRKGGENLRIRQGSGLGLGRVGRKGVGGGATPLKGLGLVCHGVMKVSLPDITSCANTTEARSGELKYREGRGRGKRTLSTNFVIKA